MGKVVGFLQGEGTITINSMGKGFWSPRFQIANTEKELLDEQYKILVEMGYKPVYRLNLRIKTQIGTKPLHQLYFKGIKQVYPFLISIKPHLVGRKLKLANLVIEWCKLREGVWNKMPKDRGYNMREKEIIKEVKILNGSYGVRGVAI
jgi:hypothetical protein